MNEIIDKPVLTKKDFTPDNEPRWCPGCGDYSILNTIQKVFPELGVPKENFVVVSGIGCSSRFPYYMSTYGFHTLHGRAPTVATGIKTANPELSVWMVTGDGDGLSIGANHLMHLIRRNPDIKVLLFNNRIYGLTKGQYSPTSETGKVTKSSPLGSVETPINPLAFAIASQATFVARTLDNNPKHMTEVFKAAAQHKGLAFIEIFQNCVIFNNKTFDSVYGRENKSEQLLFLEDGKPMIYGANSDKAIVLNGTEPKIIHTQLGDALVHHAQNENPGYAFALAQMSYPEYPTPVGVFRAVEKPTFEDNLHHQIKVAKDQKGEGQLEQLILGNDYWEVKNDGQREVITSSSQGNPALQEEQDIVKERVKEDLRYLKDPIAKVFNTRLEEILHTYGSARCVTVSKETSIKETLALMKRHVLSSIVVLNEGQVVGIVTERDILFKVVNIIEDTENTPVAQIMTPQPESAASWESVAQALHSLGEGGYRHLPVVREGGAIGMISAKGIMHFLHRQALPK
jgi:2-oxoglutarate/2-oxoacid ferredoxin oxidoreductase subunit beta